MGYVVFINGGAVSWRSKLQSLTALSTAEAEYVALCEAAREVKFLADVVQFLGLSHSFGALIIMGNNDDNIPASYAYAWDAEANDTPLKEFLTKARFTRV